MSKTTFYIVAVLACAAYWALFIVILVSIGGGFERLGIFWKILFFWIPIVGIWKFVTSLGKKKDENDNKPEKEN
jgi:hypothetical protein